MKNFVWKAETRTLCQNKFKGIKGHRGLWIVSPVNWNSLERIYPQCSYHFTTHKYKNRKFALGPSIKAFEELLVDELDRKYKNDKWRKYEENPSEYRAIHWMRTKKGLHHINPLWLPHGI